MSIADAPETWVQIPGTRYEVSDLGNVRSQAHPFLRGRAKGGRVLTRCYDGGRHGYPRVTLRVPGRKNAWHAPVHILVCTAFHGPRPEGCVCAHADDDNRNCRADNLRWTTPDDNRADRYARSAADDNDAPPF
jgi:hypothetical protein